LPAVPQSIAQLLAQLQSPRVVITGGEPFIHRDLPELVEALLEADKQVSIETSGAYWLDVSPLAWITLSPKEHVNPKYPVQELFWTRANEIKLVVSTGEEVEFYHNHLVNNVNMPVFLQPEWNSKESAIPLILELLKQNPSYRLSLQIHKFIGVQ
jgi:organic radical activating enzyme